MMKLELLQTQVTKLLDGSRLLVLVLALAGVALAQDPASADTLAPKAFWFALAGGLLPALAVLKLWWGGTLRLPPKRLLLALALMAGALTFANFTSPLRPMAQAGWQAWLLSLILFCAGVDLFAEARGRRWLLCSLSVTALAAGAWSLAQRLGLDVSAVGLAAKGAFGGRIAGSFGNPNFAGGYFVLMLPLLAQQALAAEGWAWRWSARVAAVLALLGLGLSAGKAALLALIFAGALAGHLFFWSPAPALLKRRALSWLGAAGLLGLSLAALTLPVDSLKRLAGGPAQWAESVDFRRVTWAGTLDAALDRPLVGWGPGTFSAVYPGFRHSEAMAVQAQHAYEVTAPENWVLQVLAELGGLGLAAALFLLWSLLWPLRHAAKRWAQDADSGLALALLVSLAASLVCNLASLDLFLPSTLLPFILMAALATVLSTGKAPALSLNPENYARLLVSGGLAFMASVPIVQAQLHVQAARLLFQGQGLSQAGRFQEAVPTYELALQFDPSLLEARYFLGRSLLDAGGDSGLAKADESFAELRRCAPDYVQVHSLLGRLRAAQGRVPEAAQEYEAQLKLDPWDKDAVRNLTTLYAANARLAEAETVLAEAAQRWPEDGDIARNLAAVQTQRMKLAKKMTKGKL